MEITTKNVGKLSTYEIRQELVRRSALDIEESKINHRTMLQRLMVELVKEEKQKGASSTAFSTLEISFHFIIDSKVIGEQSNKLLAGKEEAKKLRELKKQEALQRSLERQKNPEYFAQISEKNKRVEKPLLEKDVEGEEDHRLDENVSIAQQNGDEDEDNNDDPFRSKDKRKFKIFVK